MLNITIYEIMIYTTSYNVMGLFHGQKLNGTNGQAGNI